MKKILLLEDDTLLAQTLCELLELNGYEVTLVSSGDDASEMSYSHKYDLYIFDINVPDINGIDLLGYLREANDDTPAIFISALLDLNSISKAFSVGAEDYIKKPFFPQELIIRVDAKLKIKETTIKYKNLEYDINTKILKIKNQTVALGEVQEQLLELFITNIGKIMDKDILMECLEKPTPTALRVAINKLKQTTQIDIKNIRGVGYVVE
ncbi:MAG: response regulator transcription factor [Epsilonproteobacteria bacterium]|nr:response regulator transcription factor [Campylobacterota bacterium]